MAFPSPWQTKVIDHIAGHLQIVACAGSGKTETISARIVKLLTEGIRPEEIVAFTFTDRAADELLNRVRQKVIEIPTSKLSSSVYSQLSLLRCSTMHSFCFSLLRTLDPRFNIFEIISEHQQYALLLRLGISFGLSGPKSSLKYDNDLNKATKDEIESFLSTLDVIHNELISENELLEHAPKFLQVYQNYRALLERQRILTFGLIIEETVEHLKVKNISQHPLSHIKYLFVDEYQDTNKAQEDLIAEFTRAGSEICVVGDDDQCIYEWRGSNVGNFLNFGPKYGAQTYELPENRRNQPVIFKASFEVAHKIKFRKDKTMLSASTLEPINLKRITAIDPEQEATLIVDEIKNLTSKDGAYSYSEIAILLRSVTTSGYYILNKLAETNTPFRLIGSASLLSRPDM